MEFPMYKLIDDIRSYQKEFGKDPKVELIKDWAENYAEDEKDFYYPKHCSKTLTYIMMFSIYLLGILSSLIALSLLV
jgi:hypothetical protein